MVCKILNNVSDTLASTSTHAHCGKEKKKKNNIVQMIKWIKEEQQQ